MPRQWVAMTMLATATARETMDPMNEHHLEIARLHRKLASSTCSNSEVWYKKGETHKDCEWVATWEPRCSAKGWDNSLAMDSCASACTDCTDSSSAEVSTEGQILNAVWGTPLYDATSEIVAGDGDIGATTDSPVVAFHPMGSITALIPEAADAKATGATIEDGMSGDTDFPFGNLKPLATVGEHFNGEPVVGVPDGMGAYLLNDTTVRLVVQSESYGFVSGYESHPWITNEPSDMVVNDGAASYTGSHVQFADIDRDMLAEFMDSDYSAEGMIKDLGNIIEHSYNLKGELVGPRNKTMPTTVGAHYSNTDADGNYVLNQDAKYADWLMQSLCSAHLEEPEQWGEGIGLVDRMYVTNEEWMTYGDTASKVVGLSAHAVDTATKTAYALGVFHQGGFEKITEFHPGSTDFVAFAISGYNGAFSGGTVQVDTTAARNEEYGNTTYGVPYVWPNDVHPARVYVGKKGVDETGAEADDFLSRNGLRYGKVYGFACDVNMTGNRDDWHRENFNGATVEGQFIAVDWMWEGNVVNFEHDAAWLWQDHPAFGNEGLEFWNAGGHDADGAKTEHISPVVNGTMSAYVQSSTAGYFGKYELDLEAALASGELPDAIDTVYTLYQGETDVVDLIDLGGKGQLPGGYEASTMYESVSYDEETDTYTVESAKTTFEDIDGLEVISAEEGHYVIIQEDGGNDFGERTFIAKLQTMGDMDYKFIAQSGGSANSRMMAGVGIPAGVNLYASSHEFSGVVDLSGMLATDDDGNYLISEGYKGYEKRDAEKMVSINDKVILLGLQSHNMVAGVIHLQAADRGGQWLIYKPSL